ncbi:efflux RND transporter periplasmic adaptor subunit [Pseudenhygromyxa sp. WMMC2535]|uniref:efflux RND transporter periplasmic adaptor subunit n=1 Tax=Pseudenhygromyxa sp. WMMC2535 TaxID=2712867 RepID=UPI001552C347|nr:efflux RND transporter periplasmic adaptor subunit [Pseudenhygromyxa sp. WMMC2535]NVB38549.1 efflux RND transporter periplasmic adaptor subunit [Pseudenhygromyxa sp. WMMC2535]
MNTTRTIALAAALSCLAACDRGEEGAGLPDAKGDSAPARAEIPLPSASQRAATEAVESGSHRWIGSVKAKHHVELAPQMTGVISSIEVEEGDRVEAGDRLFRIEGSAVKLGVAQANAALAGAELQLADAQREAERTAKLAQRGSVGAANLERAEAGVEAAEAGVKQAKAALGIAKARTADLLVKSPISGVVTSKYKSVGELATMAPPTTVLVIDDLSVVEVRVRVPELKLREIDVGSSVSVYLPALDDTREVPVTRIGNAVDPHTRTIELIIDVQNPDMRIKAGMSVEVGLPRKQAAASDAQANDAQASKDPASKPTAMAEREADQDPV